MSKLPLPDLPKMIERNNVLKLALDAAITKDHPRFIAIKNSFRDLAECFSPVPDRVKKVIIFKEKHGDLHYDAGTKEREWWAFYDVVTNRNNQKNRTGESYWYAHLHELADDPDEPEPPKTPLEDAEGAEEPIANAIKAMWYSHNQKVKEINEMYFGKKLLNKALASEGKDASAKRFLEYEQEDYYTESVNGPPPEVE